MFHSKRLHQFISHDPINIMNRLIALWLKLSNVRLSKKEQKGTHGHGQQYNDCGREGLREGRRGYMGINDYGKELN